MQNLMIQFVPSPKSAAISACIGLVLFCIVGWAVAICRRRGMRPGDTRKLFHFCVFNTAALLRWQVDAGGLVVFGSVVALGIFYCTWRGHGHGIFEAIARPSDIPRQRLHVIVPLICTAVCGVLAQLIAGRLAIVAYLIGGWGDAVGEPIGIRWGRHRYVVPSLGGIPSTRSIEGSLAVFLASSIAAAIGLVLVGQTGPYVLGLAALLGLVTTIVEAISPHGLDNLTILLVSAAAIRWLTDS
jgi:phytol kinase